MLKPKKLTTMRDVALALSSGGARGLAHIGAIEELEQQGYRIRSVAGCSMGALVGGMYAAGRLAEFKEWMQTVDRRKMLSLLDLSRSINHLVKGEKVIDALKEIVPDVAIEDLPVEYQAIATDWKNGREVVFSKGSLYDAIRASISLPLFFNPVRRGDMILVDGGVVNPLPLKQASSMAGDMLVAVNVSGSYWGGETKARQLFEARRRHSRSLPLNIIGSTSPKCWWTSRWTVSEASSTTTWTRFRRSGAPRCAMRCTPTPNSCRSKPPQQTILSPHKQWHGCKNSSA